MNFLKDSRNVKFKQQDTHSNEVNRTGRTALLIDNLQKIDKNFSMTLARKISFKILFIFIINVLQNLPKGYQLLQA